MKSDIATLHKKIYENTKKRALSYFSKPGPLLKKYQKDQVKHALRPFKKSSITALIKSIIHSDIIYLGDFHTFDQNSKNLERIIKALLNNKNELILSLEMVYGRHQEYIDAFCQGDITELEFLESINYHESWRFPWNHYKILFNLAREKNFRIVALNSMGNLEERDNYASNILTNLIRDNPDTTILVLFGELHIVPDKIPGAVLKKTKALGLSQIKHTIIHQNLDEVYWNGPNQSNQEAIYRFSSNEFSLQTSPPWIKYESLIYWYENLSEDPDFDIHEYLIETGAKTFSSNAHYNFLFICNEIFKSLKITHVTKGQKEDFNLYDHSKLKFISSKIMALKERPLLSFFTYLLTTGQPFKIPYTREYYCASYSFNRLSYLVGNHIFHLTHSKNGDYFLEDILRQGSHEEKFLTLLQLAMISYFSSKIINPHRKCDLYQDLNLKLKAKEISRTDKAHIQKALTIIDKKMPLNLVFAKCPLPTHHEVAKIVGHLLSEIIYEKVALKGPIIPLAFIKEFFFTPDLREKQFHEFKGKILKGPKFKKRRKRYF